MGKIIGAIPARKGSKGIKGKNIALLNGHPLVSHAIMDALRANRLDRVIVSTDSMRIAKVAREYGAAVITRPPDLATDTAPIEWSLMHVVNVLEGTGEKIDIVCLLQADVPFRTDGIIDECVEKLMDTGADSVVTVREVPVHPHWMYGLESDRITLHSPTDVYRRQDLPKLYFIDGACEAVKRDILMDAKGEKIHDYLGEDVRAVVNRGIYVDVESEEDLKLAEKLRR